MSDEQDELDKATDAIEESLRFLHLAEVGKVFNAKNKAKLRQARQLLHELIGATDDEENDEDQKKVKLAAGESDRAQVSGEPIALVEASVRSDGTVPIKLISPGWGTSGYYSKELLEREGPKTFPKGTHMYWDHPAKSEESDRPERSLRDLAAVLESAPVYREDGPAGPGLYAEGKVRSEFRSAINELAPHIGTSIRAFGQAKLGEAEGKKGRIVEHFVGTGQSIDFVTLPGRGGKVLSLFESFRGGRLEENDDDHHSAGDEMSEQELREVREANRRLTDRILLRDARDAVTAALRSSGLPPLTQVRLVESLAANPPLTADKENIDEVKLKERIDLSVTSEADYLAKLSESGHIRGMGGSSSSGVLKPEEIEADLTESFKLMGLDEKSAKVAAVGRAN